MRTLPASSFRGLLVKTLALLLLLGLGVPGFGQAEKPSILVLPPSKNKITYSIELGGELMRASDELSQDFVATLLNSIQTSLQKAEKFDIKDREFLEDIQEEKLRMLRGDVAFTPGYAEEIGVGLFLRLKSVVFEFKQGFETQFVCRVQVALADARGVTVGKMIEVTNRAKGAVFDPLDPRKSSDKRYSNLFAKVAEEIVKSLPPPDELAKKAPGGAPATTTAVSIHPGFASGRYMVLIASSTGFDQAAGSATDEMAGALAAVGLTVIDKDVTVDLHDQALKEIQRQAPSESFLNRLKRSYGADFVILGSVTTEVTAAAGVQNPIVVANFNGRLVRTKDAATMFSANESARGQDPASSVGMQIAASRASKLFIQRVLARMRTEPGITSAPDAGEEIELTIRNVASFAIATRLVKEISGAASVLSAERTGFAQSTLQIRLVVQRKTSDAVLSNITESAAVRSILGNLPISVTSVNENKVEMVIGKR